MNNKKRIYFLSARTGGPLIQYRILTEEFKRKGYDARHLHSFLGWIKLHFIYGRNKYIISNIPFVLRFPKSNFFLNIHGNYKKEKNILRNPLGFIYTFNLWWSRKVIVTTRYLKNVLSLKSAEIIFNALSTKDNSNENRNAGDNKEIVLLTVTSFEFKEKAEGILRIIKILSKIKSDKKIIFKIFGKGHFEDSIKKEAEKINLPPNIKILFCGYSDNLLKEYSNSDIFVYWSDLDNMPMALLEAMDSGLPIVTNAFPSFFEFIHRDNFITSDKKIYENSLNKLINSSELRESIGSKNKNFSKNFNSEKIADQWISVIF